MLWTVLIAAGLRVFLATPVAPAPGIALEPAGPLEPGRTVTVRWQGLPPAVEECEILLEIGGGGTTLRVSGPLEPRADGYAWTVPNLNADEARLVLRMNRFGREVVGARSAPFTLRRIPGEAPAALRYRNAELWFALEEEAPEPEPVSTSGLAKEPRRVGAPRPDAEPSETQEPSELDRAGALGRPLPGFRLPCSPCPAAAAATASPRSFPRRI